VTHASEELIEQYVRAAGPLPAQLEWALEAHLETCADCRARLAAVPDPALAALVDRVWAGIAPQVAAAAPVRTRGWLVRGLRPVPAMLPWALSTLLVALLAALTSLVTGAPDNDAALLLYAPVVPVLGVAAGWSRALDPLHELAAATPRAGLPLLLRRTALALVLTVPLLVGASALLGTSPLLWLLPGLVCTLVALAAGSVVGVERASAAVATAWLVGIGSAGLAGHPVPELPVPVGAGLAIASVVVLVLRAGALGRV
jgi:hypothetical protein